MNFCAVIVEGGEEHSALSVETRYRVTQERAFTFIVEGHVQLF